MLGVPEYTSYNRGIHPEQSDEVSCTMEASPFIAFSLLLMVIVAVAALFMSGRTSKSANCDDPEKPGKKQEDHKFF
ncbi:MAG: hypothetical protein ABW139_00270 [Candidatus Thiodiazotropha sp. DIVDIV]